jgi:hypothetical protein
MSRTVIAVISDTHINSAVALRTADPFTLDDGDESLPSKSQIWLASCFAAYIDAVKRASRKADSLVLLHCGDVIEGDAKKRSTQIVTRNMATAKELAVETLLPLINICDRYYQIRGTSAHTGKSSQLEEDIARELQAETTDDGRYSGWSLLREFGGVLIEATHHTSGTSRPWTAGGPAVRLAAETVMEYGGRGERIPDLVLRGHIHQVHDSHDLVAGTRAITLPAWTLATEHVHRIGQGVKLPHIGGLIVMCDATAGRMDVQKLLYTPQRGSAWQRQDARQRGARSIYRK